MVMFTPATALVGGLVLGTATAGKLMVSGRILGISGAVKGFVQGSVTSWRVAFMLGMLAGAFGAARSVPADNAGFDVLPDTFTPRCPRGLLVGLGAALGNGCTSGHGISGNARLSPRSLVFTLMFMVAGMAAATLTNSAAAVGIAPLAARLVWPHSDVLRWGLLLLGSAVLTMAALAGIAKQVRSHQVVSLAAEFASGALFSFGLVYTGMVRPTKVIAFLSPTHPAWDPSLAFVMGGALLVALPAFQTVMRRDDITRPFASHHSLFQPTAAQTPSWC
ncbi:hypothetical protein COO60DRAFT_53297 [Scenedesmus sp. NREL 46B-D3]|nr:hypothetical protein COO60DRAFT_53297 [Scenedesmus sp. NREL 46B-D3]